MKYYDFILSGIITSLIIGVSIGLMTPLPVNLAAGVGALTATGFMYHGMFQNAPVVARETRL